MSPAMQTEVPPRIQNVLTRLKCLDDDVGRDAAAIISAFVAQVAPDHLTVCLSTNTARRAGVTVNLSPSQAVLLHELSNSFPSVVSVPRLGKAMWGAHAERSINTVRVMLTDLRKRLTPVKVLIQNQNGFGYRLELQPIT